VLVTWLAGTQAMAGIHRDDFGRGLSVTTVTGTPREVMEQRRHDARCDLKVMLWTALVAFQQRSSSG